MNAGTGWWLGLFCFVSRAQTRRMCLIDGHGKFYGVLKSHTEWGLAKKDPKKSFDITGSHVNKDVNKVNNHLKSLYKMSRTKLKDAISDSTDPSPDLMPATGQNFNRRISRITPLALTFSHILLLSEMSLYNYYNYYFYYRFIFAGKWDFRNTCNIAV